MQTYVNMILVIDNYDSFVFNLARYFEVQGATCRVIRNDEITCDEIHTIKPDALVISPGPCAPKDAGISLEVIRHFSGKIPIFGVCLGHQAIGEIYGGKTVRSSTPLHGQSSEIYHDNKGLFANLPSPFKAGRYHSLSVNLQEDSPLTITAKTNDGDIMGLQHKTLPVYGVQFHPESILTEYGERIISNFLELVHQFKNTQEQAA